MSRIFPAILVSLLVNFFLFLMMTQILTGNKLRPKEQIHFRGIERINFKTQKKAPQKITPATTKRPALPKAPRPLKITALPALVRAEPAPAKPTLPKLKQDEPEIKQAKSVISLPLEQLPAIAQDLSSSKDLQKPEDIDSSTDVPITEDLESDTIEIDVLPLLRTQPRYPRRAIRAKLEGMVTIEFTIQTDGSVFGPVVVSSVPPNIFDRAALRAIRLWKFRPKQRHGKAVTRRAIQNIRFSLKSRKY